MGTATTPDPPSSVEEQVRDALDRLARQEERTTALEALLFSFAPLTNAHSPPPQAEVDATVTLSGAEITIPSRSVAPVQVKAFSQPGLPREVRWHFRPLTSAAVDALLQQLAELEARSPPPDRDAILADCQWLQSHWIDDTLSPYRGTCVVVYNGAIVGAADDPLALKIELARKFGVHPQRFVIEYVPRALGS